MGILPILAHYVGDYALQDNWMVENKGKDIYILFAHSCIHQACLYVALGSHPVWLDLYCIVYHMVVDKAKILGYINNAIDQFLHIAMVVVCMVIANQIN